MKRWQVRLALITGLAVATPGASPSQQDAATVAPAGKPEAHYYSTGPLEPDKIASAWLIMRHIAPGSKVSLLPTGAQLPPHAIPFDEPGLAWSRQPTRSAYEEILMVESVRDSVLAKIGLLVRSSELARWALRPGSAEAVFDLTLRHLARSEQGPERAFGYLDSLYANKGVIRVPE